MSQRENVLNVLYIETSSATFASDLQITYPTTYEKFGDITNETPELAYYPDDYGVTGPNPGSQVIERSDLDYMNVSEAWDITTGNGVKIGICDARLNDTNADLSGKVTFINPCSWTTYNANDLNTHHGTAVAGIAAARGDNKHASTGVCYNCNVIASCYTPANAGYNNLLSMAIAGAQVINISWVDSSFGAVFSQGRQNLINEIVEDYLQVPWMQEKL